MDLGTAVGVASLGIQVCQGLLKYYHDWKDFDDDIEEAYNSVNDLYQTFRLLNDKLNLIPENVFVLRAKESLIACTSGIEKLEKRLAKLQKDNPVGMRQKTQAASLRLLYPFRKSTLEKLKEIVQDLMHHLSLAVQAILLDNTDETRKAMIQVRSSINDISSLATRLEVIAVDAHTEILTSAAKVGALLSAEEERLLREILNWLSAPDPSIDHNAARKKHQSGTGQWFLGSENYEIWVSGTAPLMWLHGKAGCCKTILCSTIVDATEAKIAGIYGAVLAYFYFTFSDERKRSYENMLLSLVTSLSRNKPASKVLVTLYKKTLPGKATVESLEEVLIALLRDFDTPYLIIDALDECPEHEREAVIEGLRRITRTCTRVRLLMTSRREQDIEDQMAGWFKNYIAVDEGQVNADIDHYVKNALATEKKLMSLPEIAKQEIINTFKAKSDGMFRWAALQLDSIRNLKVQRREYISVLLDRMPATLYATYDDVLSSIDEMYVDEVRTALRWLAYSNAPLSTAELAEACSISFKDGDENEPFLRDGGYEALLGLLSTISPFVVVGDPDPYYAHAERGYKYDWHTIFRPQKFVLDAYSRSVRLSHFSVKEYLTSAHLRDSNPRLSAYAIHDSLVHYELSHKCCAYFLCFTEQLDAREWFEHVQKPGFSVSELDTGYILENFLANFTPSYPMLEYVSNQWFEHQASAESSSTVLPDHQRLYLRLLHEDRNKVSWLRLHDPYGRKYRVSTWEPPDSDWDVGLNDGGRLLYWTSMLNMRMTVARLCGSSLGQSINEIGGNYGTALQAAVAFGHETIVRLLLENGANITLVAGYFHTALQAAVWTGHDNLVSLLIQEDPLCINVRGNWVSALEAAISYPTNNHIASQLLRAGADPDGHISDIDGYGHLSPGDLLTEAARVCDVQVVDLLITNGATIQATSRNLLSNAVDRTVEDVALLLLRKVTTFDCVVLDGALLIAVERGHEKVTQALISAGAAVADQHEGLIRALSTSMKSDTSDAANVLEILIRSGFDITDCQDLLIAASQHGRLSMVTTLLHYGIDVNGSVEDYGTAITSAALYGHEQVIRALLDAGASPNVDDWNRWTRPWLSITPLSAIMIFCLDTLTAEGTACTLSVMQMLIQAGVPLQDGPDALCRAILRDLHFGLIDRVGKTGEHIESMVNFLLDNGVNFSNPLGTVITTFMKSSSLPAVAKFVVEVLELGPIGCEHDVYLEYLKKRFLALDQNLHKGLILHSCLRGFGESVGDYLRIKAHKMDATTMGDYLAALFWEGRHNTDAVYLLEPIVDTMLKSTGPDDSVYDEVLEGDLLMISMQHFVRPHKDPEQKAQHIKQTIEMLRARHRSTTQATDCNAGAVNPDLNQADGA